MYQGKIPIINDKFDLAIFLQIVRKNYWAPILFVAVSFVASFLYLRYTQPVYQTQSIIQINETNNTTKVLKIEDVYQDNDILKVIELLRSKEFLKRTFLKLPIQISYFSEGTFLSTELYRRSPFQIEWKMITGKLYDIPVYIEFDGSEKALIYYGDGGVNASYPIEIGKWSAIRADSIRCTVSDYLTIESQKENYKGNRFYFVISNPKNIVENHLQNLDIFLLNRSAQTIQISYSGYNAEKASDIVNTIAEEYLKYDVEIKKESAANILAFIEERLKQVYHSLDETEKELVAFKRENKINTDQFKAEGSPFPYLPPKSRNWKMNSSTLILNWWLCSASTSRLPTTMT
ncbi:MAG TPA: hypothetical protein DEQ03_10810 [Marinilabiliales bacterium]|nr:hypothetical protein [Marinilabiliales bacterium]